MNQSSPLRQRIADWSPEVRNVFILAVCVTIVRLVGAALMDLGIDEAYYWTWSRHLAASYYDHPPMVAYLISLSTMVLGDGPLPVRLPAIVLSAFSIFLVYRLAHRIYNSERIGWLAALYCTLCPLTFALGLFMIPDAPLLFFSLLAMNAFWDFANGRRRAWCLFGIALGLALLSKYTAIVFVVSACIFLVSTTETRRHLLSQRGFTKAVALAFLIFLPVILWNAQHHWISFSFQIKHGLGESGRAWWVLLLASILAQIGYVSPVLWAGSVGAAVRAIKHYAASASARFLVAFGVIPVAFFLLAGLRSPGLPHWAGVGYAVLLLGVAAWSAERQHVKKWMFWGTCALGTLPMLVLSTHAVLGLVDLPATANVGGREVIIRDPTAVFHGWDEWSRTVEKETSRGGKAAGVAAVVTHSWIIGGKASYALRGKALPVVVWRQGRTSQFDFWSTPDDYIGRDLLFVTTSEFDSAGRGLQAHNLYEADHFESLPDLAPLRAHAQSLRFHMEILRGFRGLARDPDDATHQRSL